MNAKSGWTWVRLGFALFRKRPAEMSALFFAYLFLNLVVCLVPLIGPMLPLILVPVFAISFMQACHNIDGDQAVSPGLLWIGFRSPALSKLLTLGLCNIAALVLAEWISSLADGGALRTYVRSMIELDTKYEANPDALLGIIVFFLAYLPGMMAFWHSAPLVVWQRLSVPKALFFSFFAVLRAWQAFIIYGISWIALRMLIPMLAGNLIHLVFGSLLMMALTAVTVSMILTIAMYCSFYPTYTDVFGKPDEENQPAA
ncbi:MAG: hypothetical protein HYR68_04720 [Burkholderiales bacterium]|nr:hypothetical protein [Burkholderiales bacterium]